MAILRTASMIERYTDHAANERTYLAWVRTALAFMAFGLLVERFDLFVRSLPGAANTPSALSSGYAQAGGLILIVLGVVVLAISSRRYLHFKMLIASDERRDFRAVRTDLVLVFIVGAIGLLMALYVLAYFVG